MAFTSSTHFEVDSATGNNSNGGGFDQVTGSPGTNYAWGAGQTTINYTDLVIATPNTTASSVIRPFIAADVGNIINISAGTTWTTGRYLIKSVNGGTGVATFDRALGTIGGTGGTGVLGGSIATIQEGINAASINTGAIADDRVYIKYNASPYTSTVALTTVGAVAASLNQGRVIGYFSTHDDNPLPQSGHQPVFAVGSGAGVNGLTTAINGISFWCITFDGAATSGSQGVIGISSSGQRTCHAFCKVMNFSSTGIISNGAQSVLGPCEVTNCNLGIVTTTIPVIGCWSHKNAGAGFTNGINFFCLSSNNGGDGFITISSHGMAVSYSIAYGNTGNGITESSQVNAIVMNNIFAKNTGAGISRSQTSPVISLPNQDYNSFYSNGGVTGSSGTHDQVITTNPFVSSDADLASETSPNWDLNNTSLAGAALRAMGFPGNLPGLSTSTGFQDIGLFQHQDSGGGGGAGPFSRIFTGQ